MHGVLNIEDRNSAFIRNRKYDRGHCPIHLNWTKHLIIENSIHQRYFDEIKLVLNIIKGLCKKQTYLFEAIFQNSVGSFRSRIWLRYLSTEKYINQYQMNTHW